MNLLYNKYVLDKQLSRSLCFNCMHYVRKNNLFLARLLGTSANSHENYRRYNFQAVANFSGNFRKYKNSAKFTTLAIVIRHVIVLQAAKTPLCATL